MPREEYNMMQEFQTDIKKKYENVFSKTSRHI